MGHATFTKRLASVKNSKHVEDLVPVLMLDYLPRIFMNLYRYDRRTRVASSAAQILQLIVQKALDDRNTEALVEAYFDELREDWGDGNEGEDPEPGGTSSDHNQWLTRVFGILHSEPDVFRVMSDTYAAIYRRLVKHTVSHGAAVEAFMFPLGFPTRRVPKVVAVAVAEAMARRDAAEANQMRVWVEEAGWDR